MKYFLQKQLDNNYYMFCPKYPSMKLNSAKHKISIECVECNCQGLVYQDGNRCVTELPHEEVSLAKSNPTKYIATHLQSDNYRLFFMAKLLLEDKLKI